MQKILEQGSIIDLLPDDDHMKEQLTPKKATDWKWTMKDDYPKEKNGLKVFSCFACGGGSTMGYKLAGCDVLGCCEIDPRMNKVYVKNHNPKYNYLMDIRDFNKLDNLPDELYNLDILDGSPPCFEKGTLIRTKCGYKNIEDIIIGDYVFTHKGNYKYVYDTMKKKTTQYYELKIQGCIPIKVTPDHPFYVRRMSRHNKDGVKQFGEPKWVEVKDLSILKNSCNTILEQDYVGFPIIREQKLPIWNGINYKHNIYGKKEIIKTKHSLDLSDLDFWYFVGRYIGDGWQRDSRKETIICCGKAEKNELENIIRNANFSYTLSEQKTTYRATISNVELYEYLKQFGKGALNKHLTSDILELPIKQLRSFIDGYLSADGHKEKDNVYTITSVSKHLIFGIQQCIAKCYHQPTNITVKHNSNKIENRNVNCHIAYTLTFRKLKTKQQHFIYENGYLWLPFRNKTLIQNNLDIYNLSVTDDESYTVYNLACHNCSTFSMAGQREEAWGKEKRFKEGQKLQTLDDLPFIFIETVDKLRPKVVIMENVEGLLLGEAFEYCRKIYKMFSDIGYKVRHKLLCGEDMGVPQKRHRVFFIATRLNFDLEKIDLNFFYEPITYGEITSGDSDERNGKMHDIAAQSIKGEKNLADVLVRLGEKYSMFGHRIIDEEDIIPTILSGHRDIWLRNGNGISKGDIISAQTFPQDYDFGNNSYANVEYICGMSVPPIMIKRIVTRIIESGIFEVKL